MFFYRQASSLEVLSWCVAIMHGNAVSALVILYASRGLIICWNKPLDCILSNNLVMRELLLSIRFIHILYLGLIRN